MNLIFTVLTAFAFGYFIRPPKVAVAIWLAADAMLFTFQTLNVLMDWMAHRSPSAFGDFPTAFPVDYSLSEQVGYGVMNLVIVVAGVCLLLLGGKVRTRRDARRNAVSVGT